MPPGGALFRALAALSLCLSCRDSGHPDGAACSTAAECASGLCFDRPGAPSTCAHRCSERVDCSSAEVCGRFDFRSRDDAGLPVGSLDDVVRVCRAPLNRRCEGACPAGERCVFGLCVAPCDDDTGCNGRHCVSDGCGQRACAAPCDDLSECPTTHSCDLAHSDRDGHGECIPIAPQGGRDAGSDGACAADR